MAISRRTTKTPGKAAKTPQANPQTPRATPPRRNFARTPQPQASPRAATPASTEPLLDDPMIEEVQEAQPVHASPTTEVQHKSSARNAARRGGPSPRGPSGSHIPAATGDSKAQLLSSGREGAEIGNLQRRGWSMVTKFSVFTLLVILLITSLFGWVSIRSLENSLTDEVLRSGHQQVLMLHTFGQRVMLNAKVDALYYIDLEKWRRDPEAIAIVNKMIDFLKEGKDNGDLQVLLGKITDTRSRQYTLTKQTMEALTAGGDDYRRTLETYKDTHPEEWAALERIIKGDTRVKDVLFFSPFSSTMPILRATKSKEVMPPPEGDCAPLAGQDKDVKIYAGTYDKQRCLYFYLPLEKKTGGAKAAPSSVMLILSVSAIDEKKRDLLTQLLLFGFLFIAVGLMISRFLALVIARPINVLVDDVNIVAKGELEHESTVPNQTKDEIGLLAMAFNRMTKNLRDARDKEREAQRLSSEVNTAKAIHQKLLPEKLPNLPILDIAVAYHCAKEVGGDYYDFIPVGDNEHLGFCVADVSGKGIPGSMVMGTTRTYLRMMAVNNYSAADVLAKTNSWVVRDMKRGMFVTCVYAIVNIRTREMTVASAGHNPMLIWRAAENKIEKVRPNGIALGFDKGPIFNRTIREEKVKLNVGDRVVMYTDGVVESMNEKREEWTDEKFDVFTLQYAKQPSKEYVRLLIKALMDHQGRAEQHDDITVVTFKMKAPGEDSAAAAG